MDRPDVTRVVCARLRFFTGLVDAFGLVVGLCLSWAGVWLLRSGDMGPVMSVTGVLGGIAISWVALSGFTARHRVDLTGIEKRDMFGRRYVPWSAVREVVVFTNYFGGFNVSLGIHGARHMALPTSVIGNGAELIKAILEAATTSNPDVVLRAWSVRAFGAPPFGIFAPLEGES